MRAAAISMADRQSELHWLPDPRFLIQGSPTPPPRGPTAAPQEDLIAAIQAIEDEVTARVLAERDARDAVDEVTDMEEPAGV